jgi:outer membrane protein OmpA-like peptidoglycan-associated protein
VRAAAAPPPVLAMADLPAPAVELPRFAASEVAILEAPPVRETQRVPRPVRPDTTKKAIVVRSVHFAINSSTLSAESRALLDRIAELLRQRPGLVVVLEGHTDPRGNPATNHELSRRRAQAVRAHFVAAGLDGESIAILPLGPNRRRSTGHTTRDYALDRRVEVRVFPPDGSNVVYEEALDLQEEGPR